MCQEKGFKKQPYFLVVYSDYSGWRGANTIQPLSWRKQLVGIFIVASMETMQIHKQALNEKRVVMQLKKKPNMYVITKCTTNTQMQTHKTNQTNKGKQNL